MMLGRAPPSPSRRHFVVDCCRLFEFYAKISLLRLFYCALPAILPRYFPGEVLPPPKSPARRGLAADGLPRVKIAIAMKMRAIFAGRSPTPCLTGIGSSTPPPGCRFDCRALPSSAFRCSLYAAAGCCCFQHYASSSLPMMVVSGCDCDLGHDCAAPVSITRFLPAAARGGTRGAADTAGDSAACRRLWHARFFDCF